jgi:hypothetical protein
VVDAEQIYEKEQWLKRHKDYITKLEIQQSMAEMAAEDPGLRKFPSDADLESRISAAYATLAENEAELAQMESDYRG